MDDQLVSKGFKFVEFSAFAHNDFCFFSSCCDLCRNMVSWETFAHRPLDTVPHNIEFLKIYMYDRLVFNLAAFWGLPV